MRQATYKLTTGESATTLGQTTVYVWRTLRQHRSVHYDRTRWQLQHWGYYHFSDGLRVEPTTVTLRGGVKPQTPSLPSAPLPRAHYKTQTTMPLLAQVGKRMQCTRALHYDGDCNDNSKREIRDPREDRGLRRLQRQESLLQWYVIVCVTIITTVRRRKRD